MGIIRAIRAAVRKVTLRLVKLKTSPIISGPIAIPKLRMIPWMAIKPARCSKGVTPTAMTFRLGKFNPCAIPKKIVGNRQSHRLGTAGIIAIAKA